MRVPTGEVAQLVEHTAENRGVAGSIPALAIFVDRSPPPLRGGVTLGRAVNRVKEILDEKGHDVLQIEGDATVLEAVRTMVDAGVGSLLVMDSGDVAQELVLHEHRIRAGLLDRLV